MAKTTSLGFKRLINAFRFSMQGFKAAYAGEEAFRQEVAVFLIAVPLAFWLGETALEIALLIGSIILVLVVELINSAIEAVVDRFGGEMHVLSGQAKDMGSSAVLLISINALIIWIAVVLF